MNLAIVAHHHDLTEGTGGYTARLVAGAARAHDVTLYAADFATPPPAGVRTVRVPALASRAYATILSFPLGYALRRGRHDLVHAQGWVTGRADVVTAHVVVAAWREALRASGQPAAGAERWLGGWVAGREAALLRRARRIIAPSEKARRDIARCYGRTAGVVVIPHGFPAPRRLEDRGTARRALGLPDEAFVALYVGDPRKGLRNAIAAVRRVPGALLAVVGGARARAPARLRVVASGAPAPPPGALVPDVTRAYAAADVLLHPTIYDTFGLTVAEAMAFGVPAIVSDQAGVAELIEHGRSGLIVRGDLAAESAAALERLRGDAALRETLAAGGRAVAGRHPWDDTIARTLEVYAS